MSPYYTALSLVILSNLIYHVSQKNIALQAHPVVSMLATYLIAIVSTAGLFWFFPLQTSVSESLSRLNWASWILGLAAMGLEAGFLLAYRAGWNLSLAALYCNVAVSLLLVPIGLFYYKEKLSLLNGLGMMLALIGLVLMSVKKA